MFTLMDYGPDWRQHRRAFHSQMNMGVVQRYEPAQLDVTRNLLRNILSSPQNLKKHIELYVPISSLPCDVERGSLSHDHFAAPLRS